MGEGWRKGVVAGMWEGGWVGGGGARCPGGLTSYLEGGGRGRAVREYVFFSFAKALRETGAVRAQVSDRSEYVTPERRPIASRGSGKSACGNGLYFGSSFVPPKHGRSGASFDWTDEMIAEKRGPHSGFTNGLLARMGCRQASGGACRGVACRAGARAPLPARAVHGRRRGASSRHGTGCSERQRS